MQWSDGASNVQKLTQKTANAMSSKIWQTISEEINDWLSTDLEKTGSSFYCLESEASES